MKLIYFDSKMGVNFGDQLNDLIFPNLLPGFFDEDRSKQFLGIGSILGLDFAKEPNAKKTVYSSGFAYGNKPKIDDTYDILCVRGPKTAEALSLPKEKAVTDGAYLVTEVYKKPTNKKYRCSIMMHWHSLEKYSWLKIAKQAGINFIDPAAETKEVLDQISQSELVLAEAMHAAIVADALRVPWLPIKGYSGVNSFKWEDFTQSVELDYAPISIPSLYSPNTQVRNNFLKKSKGLINPRFYPIRTLLDFYIKQSTKRSTPQAVKKLNSIKSEKGILSKDSVCNDRRSCLLKILETLKDV